jgi:hypothetical protein
MGALAAANTVAGSDRRAEVLSTYNLMAYAGVAVPVVGLGFLSATVGTVTATAGFAAMLACVMAVAVGSTLTRWHRDHSTEDAAAEELL